MPRVRPLIRPILPRQQFLALLVLAVVSASLLITYLLWSARQDALRTAQVTALNYARTLEARLDATLRRTDAVLRDITENLPPDALAPGGEARHAERINAALDANLHGFEELIALRLIDAQGDQRYVTAAASTPPANYADRSFFATYRQNPQAGLLFSEVVTGRISRQPTMVITRPVRDAQGQFRGAMLAPMDLGFFQQQFKKLDVGPNGVIFLRRLDDTKMVLRWPQIDNEVNKGMPASHPILQSMRAGGRESNSQYLAFTDGVQRLAGTISVKGYPFFLTVALSADDVLAGWRRLALFTGLSWALLLAMMTWLVWRLWRSDSERRSLEAQLRESQRMEAIGTLAGGIAHDFNNILAAILGHVALARDDLGADHPALRSLDQIRQASTRARDLVQQILAFGRRQPQALEIQPLQPLIEEGLALLRSTLPAGVELDHRLAAEPLHVRADATQVQQVLMNLCTNAWHALQGQTGQVLVGLEAAPGPAGGLLAGQACAHLWVRDSGVGMDADTRARIFEPFFTTKPTGQGTGLGLSVVHGIVTGHQGAIRVDSAPGQGSTVHLYFPLCGPEDGAPPAGARPVLAAPAGPAAEPKGQRVLYVDDDPVILLLVEQLLQRAGFVPTLRPDGLSALDTLRADPKAQDIVVSDHNMPGMTGLDVARAVAAIRPDLPVVICSGYITEALQQQADAAGVRRLLPKQDTLENLPKALRDVLAG
jgi:signal transduction histidine kinase/CheY-like chemotaxis protein